MSYDSNRENFSREPFYIIELDLDYCTLTYGTLPCTASGSGDGKCYNTFASTQDAANYTAGTKTYRFCTNRSPLPTGLGAFLGADDPAIIPSLDGDPSIAPTVADVGGGLGVRSSVNLSFFDHPHSDIDIDKYLGDRTYIASDFGSFWTRLRARNPNYQYRNLRVKSGYIVGGEALSENFTTRYYVVESMRVSNGKATITGKDPLRLASRDKAQVPAPSTGQLSAALSAGVTSATLTPTGVGNLEYPASGELTIDREVMSFTRSGDTLTLTRGQRNTVDVDHAEDATVQLAYVATSQQVHDVVEDLLTNYANVSGSFIPSAAWQSEVDTYLSGLISGIITKPMDVNKVLKELGESMPHYLFWDERLQKIQFVALKSPPPSATPVNMDQNIISLDTKDLTDRRVSTVFVFFGQIDPTEKLDEGNNYQQTYVRPDTDSISQYGSNEIKVIYSRWITDANKAAALQIGALIGRRFANPPRWVGFELDAKDGSLWTGQSRAINHRDIPDFAGNPTDTIFQITSAKEQRNFKYEGLEYLYGDAIPEDEGGGDPDVDLVIIGSSQQNINLRTIYNGLFPAPDGTTLAKFVIENGVVIGAASTGSISVNTGSWPAGATITLQTNSGSFVVGAGGAGSSSASVAAGDGGDALILNHNLTLINNGVIGGGGGGGGADSTTGAGSTGVAAGGGGAGDNVGAAGTNSFTGSGLYFEQDPNPGTLEFGGQRGILRWNISEPEVAAGGGGGSLGSAGTTRDSAGGAAGAAIDKNGYTLTETVTGDIRGSILT